MSVAQEDCFICAGYVLSGIKALFQPHLADDSEMFPVPHCFSKYFHIPYPSHVFQTEKLNFIFHVHSNAKHRRKYIKKQEFFLSIEDELKTRIQDICAKVKT